MPQTLVVTNNKSDPTSEQPDHFLYKDLDAYINVCAVDIFTSTFDPENENDQFYLSKCMDMDLLGNARPFTIDRVPEGIPSIYRELYGCKTVEHLNNFIAKYQKTFGDKYDWVPVKEVDDQEAEVLAIKAL